MTFEEAAIIIGNIPVDGTDECYTVSEYQEAKRLAVEALGRCLSESTKWIPVEERLPEEDKWVQVVVKRHRWISDFGNKSVPDEEKEDHPEQNCVTMGKLKKDNTWVY